MHSIFRVFLGVAAVVSTMCATAAQGSGAVWTGNKNGTVVNGNLYRKATDVYLVGGPGVNQPCSATGLPDGNYYFQVTNPSGSVLLSLDFVQDREVVVQGGVIVASVNNAHVTRNGPCGSKVVQLAPFAPTTSAGDEYKLWFTSVADYDPQGSGFFGFVPRFSKTDNFKVRNGSPSAQSILCGYKFYDHNEDGTWNPGVDPLEVPIAGWRIELYAGGALIEYTFTDASGRYCFIREQDGTQYTITEVAPGGFIGDGIPGATWLAVTPRSGTVVANAAQIAGPDFGNLRFEVKVGVGRTKGFWSNQNGRARLLTCEPQWREVLWIRNGLPVCLRTNVSSPDPAVSLLIPPFPGPGAPTPAFFGLSFPDAHDYLANWLVGDPALGHAGFILSTQIAATILNNACGFMQGTIYVDRFQNGILVSLDAMLAGATGLLCSPGAGETGPGSPYPLLRETMLNCINEFGSINETGDPSNPQVVYGKAAAPDSFGSPY